MAQDITSGFKTNLQGMIKGKEKIVLKHKANIKNQIRCDPDVGTIRQAFENNYD
jgi:hypothetical protein